MFLLVLVTCVTLEQQTMCHEFPREMEYASQDSCRIAAAMMRGQIVYESPTATIDKARLRQSVGV